MVDGYVKYMPHDTEHCSVSNDEYFAEWPFGGSGTH